MDGDNDDHVPSAPRSDGQVSGSIRDESGRKRTTSELAPTRLISGSRYGSFDIAIEEIRNFHHLIDQRIKQNDADLKKFEISIFFREGSSIKLVGIEELLSYYETRPITPTMINLSWHYDIQFNDKSKKERQEIDISIECSGSFGELIDVEHDQNSARASGHFLQIRSALKGREHGAILYSISHTNPSWGLDIENTITNHIKSIFIADSTFDVIINKLITPLNWITTVVFGITAISLSVDVVLGIVFGINSVYSPILTLTQSGNSLSVGEFARYSSTAIVVSIIIFLVVSVLVDRIFRKIRRTRPSFIVLSSKTEKNRDAELKKYTNRWHKLIVIAVINAILSYIPSAVIPAIKKALEAHFS